MSSLIVFKFSGVGLGICERLLIQLSSSNPSDSWPQESLKYLTEAFPTDGPSNPVQGLTLIMACRSVKKAELARQSLYKKLDAHIIRQKQLAEYDGHAEHFQENLRIKIHKLDLAVTQSVFDFAAEISTKYVSAASGIQHPIQLLLDTLTFLILFATLELPTSRT